MASYSFQFSTDATGKPGAAKPYREGNRDFVVPVASISGNSELLTNAVLKATEVYTQYGQDRLGQVLISKVKVTLILIVKVPYSLKKVTI